MKNIKLIFLAVIFVIILGIISIVLFDKNGIINKERAKKQAQNEVEEVSLNIDIKEETDNLYKCLLTFISNDDNDKIKSIEYPTEEGKEPIIIDGATKDGNEKISIDYEIEKGKELNVFKVTTNSGKVIEKNTGYKIIYDNNGGNNGPQEQLAIKQNNTKISSLNPNKDGYICWGWAKDKNSSEPEYLKNDEFLLDSEEDEIVLYAVWEEEGSVIKSIADKEINKSGIYSKTALGKKYNFEVTYLTPENISDYGGNHNQSTNTYTVGDMNIGTAEGITIDDEYEQAMAVLKCDGNLQISGTITTSTYSETSSSGITGDVTKIKGLFIYCSGKLINNGTITQTARGTYNTEGENVYLWSENSTYEGYTVPALGGSPGARAHDTSGKNGSDGIDRQTGGGGSGSSSSYAYTTANGYSGAGSQGTSYSGGTGGRTEQEVEVATNMLLQDKVMADQEEMQLVQMNKLEEVPETLEEKVMQIIGSTGTGGLLIIYADEIENNGTIDAKGSLGGSGNRSSGGSSGGGSINIFYKINYQGNEATAIGGARVSNGNSSGKGGDGCVTYSKIN